ncbi:MAG: hypothetical protein KKA73_26645 [Chloroflexi bacterium]|nr:hypothetical protein [Chloroflexota bacterium]MBU1751280.1 hypothetical protein [Chloroflexota bacterium]MBU1877539.1 hypothetical protein [Chloroflexota bacterium]
MPKSVNRHAIWMLVAAAVLLAVVLTGCDSAPVTPPVTRAPGTPWPSVIIPTVGGTPVPSYEAKEAIQTYANQTLGVNVQVILAGGREGTVTLPVNAETSVNAATSLAGVTYWGVLENGIASVSLGEGDISGDLQADINAASLGAFALGQTAAMPADEAAALALVKGTYPGVVNMNYQAYAVEGSTFAFYAYDASTQAIDPKTKQVIIVGRAVAAGVSPGVQEGRIIVWVIVGNGTFTSAIQK